MIAYASRRLRPSERNMENYSSMRLEMQVLKWEVTKKFRNYLLGSEFTVYTDNNPLKYLQAATLAAVEERWASLIASFKLNIVYRSGKSNVCADALSRKTFSDTDATTSTDVQQILSSTASISVMPLSLTHVITTQSNILVKNADHVDTKSEPTTDPIISFPSYTRSELVQLQRNYQPSVHSYLLQKSFAHF